MAKLKNVSLVIALLFCASFTALHHGWADYDHPLCGLPAQNREK
jgi:hypothetical protein